MKLPPALHNWNLSPRKAIAVQRDLAERVKRGPLAQPVRFIAGLDAAFSKDDKLCFGAVVLWDMNRQCVIEQHTACGKLTFPYVPGLLSFREVPTLLLALRKLSHTPDLLMCDGQGLAHPRRFGLACHLGVLCDLPSIGCAKSRLTGTHAELGRLRGSRAPLLDGAEVIGSVLRTQTGIRPVYVSIGHKIDLTEAEQIVLACATRYRLPEPTRLADQLVSAFKKQKLARLKPRQLR
jgi:deoxyribonuclease V